MGGVEEHVWGKAFPSLYLWMMHANQVDRTDLAMLTLTDQLHLAKATARTAGHGIEATVGGLHRTLQRLHPQRITRRKCLGRLRPKG